MLGVILLVVAVVFCILVAYCCLPKRTALLIDLPIGCIFRFPDDTPDVAWVLRSKEIHGTMTRYAGPFGHEDDVFEHSIVSPRSEQVLSEVRVIPISHYAKECGR